MATITSAQSGNWSDTATWVGGVVPIATDDVIIANGHLVNADVDITINKISLTSGYGNSALEVTTDRTIIVTDTLDTNGHRNQSWATITVTGSNLTVSITIGNDLVMGNYESNNLIVRGSNNNISLTCSNILPQASIYGGQALLIQGTDNVVDVTSNIYGTGISGNAASVAINVGNTCTCNITGIVECTNRDAINVTGDVTINGNVICSSTNNVVIGTGTLRILSSAVSQTGDMNAFYVKQLILDDTAEISWQMNTENPSVTKTLYTASLLTGYPLEEDVEDGVVYGPSDEFEGTLSPVIVDTAQLASNLLDDIQTSSHVVAQRLRAAATDDSVGQIVTATFGG